MREFLAFLKNYGVSVNICPSPDLYGYTFKFKVNRAVGQYCFDEIITYDEMVYFDFSTDSPFLKRVISALQLDKTDFEIAVDNFVQQYQPNKIVENNVEYDIDSIMERSKVHWYDDVISNKRVVYYDIDKCLSDSEKKVLTQMWIDQGICKEDIDVTFIPKVIHNK